MNFVENVAGHVFASNLTSTLGIGKRELSRLLVKEINESNLSPMIAKICQKIIEEHLRSDNENRVLTKPDSDKANYYTSS